MKQVLFTICMLVGNLVFSKTPKFTEERKRSRYAGGMPNIKQLWANKDFGDERWK